MGRQKWGGTCGVGACRVPGRALPWPGVGPNPRLTNFEVSATGPQALKGLEKLSRNYWWSWQPGIRELFAAVDPSFGRISDNAIQCLHRASVVALDRLAKDKNYLPSLPEAAQRFADYMVGAAKPVQFQANGHANTGQLPHRLFPPTVGCTR